MTNRFGAMWVAAALVLGIVIGIPLAGSSAPGVLQLIAVAETVGTLWVNAIRMTVIPMIVSLLIVGVASSSAASGGATVGALGARAFAFFYVALTVVALGTALAAPPLFQWLALDPHGVAALRAGAGGDAVAGAAKVPGFGEWLVSVVPTNPFRAAADGALLPLIVFTLAFAYALRQVAEPGRAAVVHLFQGTADATLVIVRWVLALAPIGVLALALVLGTRLGAGVVGAIGFYMGVQIALLVVASLAMYPVAAALGGVSMRRFARAVLPAQIVAASTRSSFAALPAGLDGAHRVLGVPPAVTGFVMPLAVSIFRYTSPVQWIVGALFVGALYGVEMGVPPLATVTVASVLLNATVPGIPSGGLLVQAPVYAAVGLPVEGLGILIAVDLIPDLFRTAGNVTGHLGAVVAVGGRHRAPSAAQEQVGVE